jgi:hypothetical protein
LRLDPSIAALLTAAGFAAAESPNRRPARPGEEVLGWSLDRNNEEKPMTKILNASKLALVAVALTFAVAAVAPSLVYAQETTDDGKGKTKSKAKGDSTEVISPIAE